MFTLDVERITEEGLTLEWKEEPAALSSYLGNFSQIDFHFEKALEATATVWKVGQSIMVKGSLNALLRLQCVRCLEEFSYPLASTFEVALFPAKEASLEEEEVELGEDEMESNFYEGERFAFQKSRVSKSFLKFRTNLSATTTAKGSAPSVGRTSTTLPAAVAGRSLKPDLLF